MIRTRLEKEALESRELAPYAQKSASSRGRDFPEPLHPLRTGYERDRARIIHSRAFRRLEHKTQVFLSGTGDHLRTRLTHTIEVASISRTIARALALNEDLAEAIALAHDLGHAPFGHSGEKMLDGLMDAHGGFEHNAQSLRIVELIEEKYPRFPGLNLSWEVREGLKKSRQLSSPSPESAKNTDPGPAALQPSLEAQIANLADEITYYSHDLDDGLDAHLIRPEQLSPLAAWRATEEEVRGSFPELGGADLSGYIIRCLIDRQVQDLITTSAARLAAASPQSAEEVRQSPDPFIGYSEKLAAENRELRSFLFAHLYEHPQVARANDRACLLLENVFHAYLRSPERLGGATARRLEEEGLHRSVCDYLSGMTDRYLLEEYGRLFSPEIEDVAPFALPVSRKDTPSF